MSILDVPGVTKAQLDKRVDGITDETLAARDLAQSFAIDALSSVMESHAIVLQVPLDAEEKAAELRKALTDKLTPGASVVTALQAGADAVSRAVQDVLLEQAISIKDYMLPIDGANIRPALLKAVTALKGTSTKSRVLLIPYVPGEWTVDQQVLLDVSNFTLLLYGNVRLTGTTRQKALLFASSTLAVPATSLKNVSVFGNGSYVNGNATEMTFTYAHGDGSDNDSAIRFSYIDNLFVQDVWADNGAIDSFSTMRCRNQRIVRCRFTRAKEDNGFSATTDWGPWEYGNFDTYSYGVVIDCTAEDNNDFGMTAYNASGVFFIRGRSLRNRGGYSYEDAYATPDAKRYHGGFIGCWAWNCREQGFYIDADGINIDAQCKSWNIRYIGANPNGLYGNGVVVANVTNVRVDGEHTNCSNAGLAIFNGTGNLIGVHAAGKYNDNDGPGIFGRGVNELIIPAGTEIKNNGKVLVNAVYNYNVLLNNSGGSGYLQGAGVLKIVGAIISGGGLGAVDSNYVGLVDISSVLGIDNAQRGSALGIRVTNATTAKLYSNHLESNTGNQTFAIDIEPSVVNGYEGNNTGTGTTGIVANNAGTRRQSMRAQYFASATYDPPSIAAGSQVAPTFTVTGAEGGDFVDVSFSTDLNGLDYYAYVSTTNNVTVYLRNRTVAAIDLASLTVRILVTKRNGG